MSLIQCHQGLRRASLVVGGTEHPIRVWDDGVGHLWLYRESRGIVGIVRATTFEEAWRCVVDQILPDAVPDCSVNQRNLHAGELPEGIHRRRSGVPTNEDLHSSLAQEDPAGSLLQPLTAKEVERWNIKLYIEDG